MAKNKLDYHALVNYDIADPAKRLAQKEGAATAKNLPFGYQELSGTRGESAYVFDMGTMYGALVQEGLGTKSLIAQSIYAETGRSFFGAIATDTVATVINDLISVGATPVALNAYWSSSSYDWLGDTRLVNDFIKGWRKACDQSKVVWGGGETQSLKGVIKDNALELAGCGFGIINPRNHLIQDKNLQVGDAILLIESSGVHANGISLARQIADKLKLGYQTKLEDGTTYGEALLQPTIIYASLIQELLDHKLDIHYLANITGHGWRKLMRGRPKLSYVIEQIPKAQPVFDFIKEQSASSEREMYSNYNMGAGYAVFLPDDEAQKALSLARGLKLKVWVAGHIEKGPKCVVIKPKDLTFSADSLELR